MSSLSRHICICMEKRNLIRTHCGNRTKAALRKLNTQTLFKYACTFSNAQGRTTSSVRCLFTSLIRPHHRRIAPCAVGCTKMRANVRTRPSKKVRTRSAKCNKPRRMPCCVLIDVNTCHDSTSSRGQQSGEVHNRGKFATAIAFPLEHQRPTQNAVV